MRTGRKGVFAAATAMTSRASNQVFLIGVTLVATRYLSPADFGVFALATAFITLARTLLYAGPFEYLMKAPDLEGSATECLAANVFLAAISALVLAAIAVASPFIFSSKGVEGLMLMLAPTILIAALASWEESQLLRTGEVQTYYLVTMGVEMACAVLAAVLLVLHYGLIALVLQNYARNILLTIIYRFIVTVPKLGGIDWPHFRGVMGWSISRYGAVIVAFLSNYSGDLILGALLSPTATGLFRASNRVVTAAADVFAQPARMIAMTSLSGRFANGMKPDGHWLRIFSGIAFLGWPALIGVALLGDWLAPVMLGPKWAAAGPIVAILAIARMSSLLSAVTSTLLVAYDRQKLVFWVQLCASLGVAGMTVLLARSFGVQGAALASAGVLAVAATTMLVKATNLGGPTRAEWQRSLTVVLVPLVTTAVGTIGGRLLAPLLAATPAAQLAIAIACGAFGWMLAVLAFRHPVIAAVHALGHDAATA